MKIRIELRVFSGRRNPSWSLEPEDARTLTHLLRTLPRNAISRELPSGLGYQGVVAICEEDGQGWSESYWFEGHSTVTGVSGHEYLLDQDRNTEKWLVRTGAGHIRPALLARLHEEMTS